MLENHDSVMLTHIYIFFFTKINFKLNAIIKSYCRLKKICKFLPKHTLINFLELLCITVVHLRLAAVCRTDRHRYRLRYVFAMRIAVICFSILSGMLTARRTKLHICKTCFKDAKYVRLYE